METLWRPVTFYPTCKSESPLLYSDNEILVLPFTKQSPIPVVTKVLSQRNPRRSRKTHGEFNYLLVDLSLAHLDYHDQQNLRALILNQNKIQVLSPGKTLHLCYEGLLSYCLQRVIWSVGASSIRALWKPDWSATIGGLQTHEHRTFDPQEKQPLITSIRARHPTVCWYCYKKTVGKLLTLFILTSLVR